MRRSELARALHVGADDRAALRQTLRTLIDRGEVTLIRRNKYVRTREADMATGTIQVTARGFGFVTPDDGTPEIYIAARNTSTAMHGDRVMVRIVEEPRPAAEPVRSARGRSHGRRGKGGRARTAPPPPAPRPAAGEPRSRAGKVLRVIERARETVVGTLQRTRHFLYVIPDDPRIVHDVYVPPPREGDADPGTKVVVRLLPWENRHVSPEGEIVEILGPADDPRIEILSIIRKHLLAQVFPETVMRAAARAPERVEDADRDGRTDLRDTVTFTIDPEDARDHDDAVSIEPTESGGWRVGIHIADVAHYVPPGSDLDREARERGNSVYLVDRVLPMLPPELSAGICSLREGEDRLAWSVFVTVDSGFRPADHRIERTVIRSRRRFTYTEVQAILDGDGGRGADPEIVVALQRMAELARGLRTRRFRRGALDLDFPEARVILDEEIRPQEIRVVENNLSHQLIEEFMLLANETVARHLTHHEYPAIYRVHDEPDPDRLAAFGEFLRPLGLTVDSSREGLQRVLRQARGRPEEYAIKRALLRSMKRAMYSARSTGHYGLATRLYLHFTSPIRRYADLVVHRVLEACVERRDPPAPADQLGKIAAHLSRTERAADDAERDSIDLMKMKFVADQIESRHPRIYDAVVTEVRNFGVFVELPALLVSGLIHVGELGDDLYRHDRNSDSLVGRATRERIRVGDTLRVMPRRVDPYKRQYDFARVRDESRR